MPFNVGGHIYNGGIAYAKDYQLVITRGLVAHYDASGKDSYPGSDTTWNDLTSNSFTATLTNGPTYSNNNNGLIVLDGTNDWVSIPGSTTIYSSNFTWQSFHFIRSTTGGNLDGMWWSEAGSKNFLTGYRNTNVGSTYFRIDTPTSVYQSPSVGTNFNGFSSTAGPASGRWLLTTIVKSGTTFSLYWNNATLMWQVTISDWSIPATSQATAFGARNDAAFATAMDIANVIFYNRALSTAEISQNYNVLRARLGV